MNTTTNAAATIETTTTATEETKMNACKPYTPKYVVKVSAARMPASCWGRYVRVGVMEMAASAPAPAMLSARAKGCRRVVETWERLHVGRTSRASDAIAIAEAHALAAALRRRAARHCDAASVGCA